MNLLLKEGTLEKDLHPDAYKSFLVDYYAAQVNNGGFSQFVYNSKWNTSINNFILEGLKEMKAEKHVVFFQERIKLLASFTAEQISLYCDGEYFGKNQTRDELNDDGFFDIEENLYELNASFLKKHKDLLVLSIPEMFSKLEAFLGKSIER